MSVPAGLDHLVLAGPDLTALVGWFHDMTGVAAPIGGKHPIGTANHLVALTIGGVRGKQYLELIGPDPDRSGTEPTTAFGIDSLSTPRLAGYAVGSADIDSAVLRARAGDYDPGTVRDLSRATPDGRLLRWRLTPNNHHDPVLPFLIDWGATPHPGTGELPALELVRVYGEHPDVPRAQASLRLLDVDLDLRPGERAGLVAVLNGPNGDLELR